MRWRTGLSSIMSGAVRSKGTANSSKSQAPCPGRRTGVGRLETMKQMNRPDQLNLKSPGRQLRV
jgi:hypothetical protein